MKIPKLMLNERERQEAFVLGLNIYQEMKKKGFKDFSFLMVTQHGEFKFDIRKSKKAKCH